MVPFQDVNSPSLRVCLIGTPSSTNSKSKKKHEISPPRVVKKKLVRGGVALGEGILRFRGNKKGHPKKQLQEKSG